MALTPSTMLQPLGAEAPPFFLPDVETGSTITLEDFAGKRALVVVFLSAHCPFVRHVAPELTRLGRAYQPHGVGIVAISPNDAEQYPADTPDGLRGPYAAVLLTVKAYDTARMVRAVAPSLADDGVVISLQNGLGNVEEAAQAVGPQRVAGGRVIFGAILTDPGRVRVTVYAEPVMVGSPDPGRYPSLDANARRWERRMVADLSGSEESPSCAERGAWRKPGRRARVRRQSRLAHRPRPM